MVNLTVLDSATEMERVRRLWILGNVKRNREAIEAQKRSRKKRERKKDKEKTFK